MKSSFALLTLMAPLLWAADADRDGVPDGKDACPDSPVRTVLANGCAPSVIRPVVLYFDTDSDRLRPEHFDQLARFVADGVDGTVVIVGHADNRGSLAHNQSLSERRSAAISNALSARYGVDPARIARRGIGETLPWRDNVTETGLTLNRRVELWVETGLRLTNGEK
ncbi:OmpA family protein [Marinobacter hydrocarbonoclasticus]|nr:OmpA family protein [Marinobacter nauticus]